MESLVGRNSENAAPNNPIDLAMQEKNRQAQCAVIAKELNLPPDALVTKLGPRDLLNFAADLQYVGAGARQSDPSLWQDVAKRGAGKVLADLVRGSRGIPDNIAQGKTAKQLHDGAIKLQQLHADMRSARAWLGLDLLEAEKITAKQFTTIFADGRDVVADWHV